MREASPVMKERRDEIIRVSKGSDNDGCEDGHESFAACVASNSPNDSACGVHSSSELPREDQHRGREIDHADEEEGFHFTFR